MRERGGILLAAGRSSRMGFDKLWADLGGQPVLAHGLRLLAQARLDELVVVVAADSLERTRRLASSMGVEARVCAGGERRRDSVAAGLALLKDVEWVVVHDAARPFATVRLVAAGLEAARETGAAVAAIPIADTVKRVRQGRVVETLSRDELWRAQTPQVFRRDLLERVLAERQEDVGDEATLVERTGGEVRVFAGAADNFKLTEPEDLRLARAIFEASRRGALR